MRWHVVFVASMGVVGAAVAQESGTVQAAVGEGVTIQSADQQVKINVRARVQVQANTGFPAPGGPESARADQVLIRRTRIALRATAWQHWELSVQLGVATSDLDPEAPSILRDASIAWLGLRDLHLRAGQMKVPFDRQRLTSSAALQFVDRSQIVGELNLDRDVGLQLYSDDFLGLGGRLHYALGVFAGEGRNRVASHPGLLYAAKATLRPLGKFEETEADFAFEPTPKVALSVAGARNVRASRQRSTTGSIYRIGTFNSWHAAVDLQLKWRGLSFLAEGLLRRADEISRTDEVLGITETSRSGLGYFAQAGFLFTPHWEAVARFGELHPFADRPGVTQTREMGLGLNWYLAKHALKLQLDYHYTSFPGGPGGRHLARVQGQFFF